MAKLEQDFIPGMTRQNYGEWHVDHVVQSELSKEGLSSMEAVKIVNWNENLQPMWGEENPQKEVSMRKKTKLI